jgi:hypothetical protein
MPSQYLSTNTAQYDYDIMAALTGNTSGSLKNMWPPVKKKAIDTYPSFAAFLGATPAPTDGGTKAAPAAAAKGATTRKRKAAEPDVAEEVAAEGEAKSASDGNKSDGKKKKAPAKPRAKKVKKEEVEEEVGKNNEGDEGLSELKKERMWCWLNDTDCV